MNIFINLNRHANQVTIPLRMGVTLTKEHQSRARLHDATYDEEGTKSQRQNEINRGNRHYLGELVIHPEVAGGDEIRLKCRAVLSEPRYEGQDPALITILRPDGNKGDMTVSFAIEALLKKNKINTKDIIDYFHKPYIDGLIHDSSDVHEIFNAIPKADVVDIADDLTAKALLRNPASVSDAMGDDSGAIEGDLMAPPIFKPMDISGVAYKYSMTDAYIDNVRLDNDMILLDTVNSKGESETIHSFKLSPRPHLSKLHQYAYEYLKSREGQRGYFAVCTDKKCRGFLAESVTAIALQMQKSGLV